jgi:predicted cupin superfamily sugar epimerase
MSEATTNPLTAAAIIEQLGLEPHVEGGYFRRTFQADQRPLLDTPAGPRFLMTAIYYLLTRDQPIGRFHRNRSDILHCFHLGDPIRYHLIGEDGALDEPIVGANPMAQHRLQLPVAGGVWKASELTPGGEFGFALISEAVAPGFEYADMELGVRADLVRRFPQHTELISGLTPD